MCELYKGAAAALANTLPEPDVSSHRESNMITSITLVTAIALGVAGVLAHGGVRSYSIGGVAYNGCVSLVLANSVSLTCWRVASGPTTLP